MNIVKNGIIWTVLGRSGKTLRVQHKCSRWEPVFRDGKFTFTSRTVMLVSSMSLKEGEIGNEGIRD